MNKSLQWLGRIFLLIIIVTLSFLLVSMLTSVPHAGAQQSDPVVALQTTKGPIFIRVYIGLAPITASNFVDLVRRGFYNGLTFHRVESWVIQGGDPNGNGTGNFIDPDTRQPRFLRLETSPMLRHNAAGVVAMAHGKSPNSGSCQFYITKKSMPALDGAYSIFAGVIKGMDVVYNIQPGDRILSAAIVSGGRDSPERHVPTGPTQGGPSGDSGF